MTDARWAMWQRRFLRAANLCTIIRCGRPATIGAKCLKHRKLAADAAKRYRQRLGLRNDT